MDKLIEDLGKVRGSEVIVYMTSSKEPSQFFGAKVARDVLPYFRQILKDLPKGTKKITLVLNTTGGMIDTAWPLVNLIREYSETFEVVVPYEALSAGTLISLGADKIIMLPYSSLSPIDPAAEFIDAEKQQQRRIEIEDIIGYIDFAKKKIGLDDQQGLVEVMKELGKEINPTMLGSANRVHSLIRSLAKKLLSLHSSKLSEHKMQTIVSHLTQELFSHRHLINRKEARDVVGFGSIIEFASSDTERAVEALADGYMKLLELDKQFNPAEHLGTLTQKDYKLIRAVVHGRMHRFNFVGTYQVSQSSLPNGQVNINLNNNMNTWEKIK